MALTNLGLVTRALVTLLKRGIKNCPGYAGGEPSISARPMDKRNGEVLSVHLVHVIEDPHFKNQPPVGGEAPPVRFNPIALNLIYQIAALSGETNNTDMYSEQDLIGFAIKVLHDYPSIDSSTKLPDGNNPPQRLDQIDQLLADLDGPENRLRLSFLPLTSSETLAFWSGQQTPPRLAIFYQVSVVLLEPGTPKTRTTRVSQLGVNTFVQGSPRLDGSESTITFTPPGGTAQTAQLRPAEAAPGDAVNGTVVLTGTGLAGASTRVLLRGMKWADFADTGWTITATENRVEFQVEQATLQGQPQTIVPGVYAAQVVVQRYVTLPDGLRRPIATRSNATPFMVIPRIDDVVFENNAWKITGFLFDHADIGAEGRKVYIGAEPLTEVGGGDVLNLGQFKVTNANTILFLPPQLAGPYPVRVVIRDAESAPRWMVLP